MTLLPPTRARRGLRTLGLAAGVLSIALGATACTSDDPSPAPAASRTTDDAAANDALYTCLMDAGFAVTRGAGGAIEFKDPEDTQGASYTAARSQCLRDLEADGTVVAAGGASLASQYASMSRLHACLTRKGVSMEAWPTEAVFVEKDGAFNVLSAAEEVTMERAAGLCPDEVAALEAQ